MLGEKDLIYFGAMLLYSHVECRSMDTAIEAAEKMYKKVFNDDSNDK